MWIVFFLRVYPRDEHIRTHILLYFADAGIRSEINLVEDKEARYFVLQCHFDLLPREDSL